MDKKDFYIFLDIDGVFNSLSWANYVKNNNLEEKGFNKEFCFENLNIFNKILKTIKENNYNSKIIIISDWKKNRMQEAISLFKKYNIDYSGNYDKTIVAIVPPEKRGFKRAVEIDNYMVNNNITLKDAFIIIDDDTVEIKRYLNIPPEYFLRTSGESGTGLNNDDFKRFKENNLPKIIQSTQNENTL